MYTQQITENLKALGVNYENQGGEIKCTCLNPEHIDSNPSFSISATKGIYHCFSCGFSGHIGKLFNLPADPERFRYAQYAQLLESMETTDVQPEPLFMPPVDHMVDYEIRGVSAELLQELGVYYSSKGRYKGRLVFPVRSLEGTTIGFDARSFKPPKGTIVDSEFPAKYLRPSQMKTKDILYPIDYISKHFNEDYLIITEGVFSALSYIEMGYPAVCNFGLGEPSIEKLSSVVALGVSTVYNGFDGDAAGLQGWQKIKEAWRQYFKIGHPLPIIKQVWNVGDANDYLQSHYDTKEPK